MTNEEKILQLLEQMQREQLEMKTDIVGLKTDMVGLKTDVVGLKTDMVEMKADIVGLKTDMVEMKADIVGLKTDMVELKTNVDKLNQTVAFIEVDHGKKLGALYDAHVDTTRNATTLQELDAKVDNHDHRIFALEQKAANG